MPVVIAVPAPSIVIPNADTNAVAEVPDDPDTPLVPDVP